MSKKNDRNTKGKIITAAWDLFYEQGYDDTTVEEIIEKSGTSKGSFYHYFEGKDALLGSLSYIFDEEYAYLKDNFSDLRLLSDEEAYNKAFYYQEGAFLLWLQAVLNKVLLKGQYQSCPLSWKKAFY